MDKVRTINQYHSRLVVGGSLALLTILVLGLLCPLVPASSFAESSTDAVVTEAGVNVGSMIAVALDPSIDIDVLPSSSTVYDKKAARLTVTTNNSSGYSLYMQTLDGTADLKSTDLSNSATISPLEQASTLGQFEANTWGYSLGRAGSIDKNRIYYPVPTNNTTVMETGGTSYSDEYDLTFGVAVSNNLPVGRYTNSVIISAVANPTVITSLNQAEYMQSMNLELCQNTDYGVTKRLTDLRDGKKYWVARLLDGNCWMTQNLALTLKDFGDGEGIKAVTEGGDMGSTINPSNSDVLEEWNTNSQYPPADTYMIGSQGVNSPTATGSYNPGKYVLATPLLTTSCGTSLTAISTCTKVGFVDVGDSNKFSPGFEATMGDWDGANAKTNTLVTVNCTEWEGTGTAKICTAGTYDEHYLVGNYYQFNAATAGTGAGAPSTGMVATSSVCPKNWKLPLSGAASSSNNTVSGSFYYLLNNYGLTSTVSSSLGYNIAQAPLYFVRTGYMAGGRTPTAVGVNGYAYSSVGASTYGSGNAYYLNINASTVEPSAQRDSGNADAYRQSGRSVRCAIY